MKCALQILLCILCLLTIMHPVHAQWLRANGRRSLWPDLSPSWVLTSIRVPMAMAFAGQQMAARAGHRSTPDCLTILRSMHSQ